MPTAKLDARITLAVLAALALAGIALGWNRGQLPHGRQVGRVLVAEAEVKHETAADLLLYRQIIEEVRAGNGYYDVARTKLPEFGFPINSPFNWRLPTYAWLWSLLPGPAWIQGVLIALAIAALALAFVAESRTSGVGYAAITTFLLFGVVHWSIDGDAYFAQEVWAAVLILISISAQRLQSQISNPKSQIAWQGVAIVSGIAALLFRELALPYCCIAAVVSLWHRRWYQAAAWTAGIAAFFAFLAWHIGQVHAQLAGADATGGAGLTQWLRFGGLDFVLLTTRMNSLLFTAPGWLLWLYIVAALIGLARRNDATSQLACLAALAYLAAFAIVGRPENFYWGLMFAPVLPWGVTHAPQAIGAMWTAARGPAALGSSMQTTTA